MKRIRYKLLSTNTKLEKQNGRYYAVAGLSLAPHSLGGFGTVCPQATPGCRASCVLWYTGRTVTTSVRAAMRRRTAMLFADRTRFESALCDDIAKLCQFAARARLQPTVRLNVASDLDWSHIAREFPTVRFYDYTKVRSRIRRADWPDNYELTYSANERSDNRTIGNMLRDGRNVAAVFSTRYWPQGGRIDPLPTSWRFGGRAWPVIDGDRHDVRLRENDGSGVIVGLRFKGSLRRRAWAIKNGFCMGVE